MAMYLHFYMYHNMGNSFQTQEEWKIFNEEIDQKTVPLYQQYAMLHDLPECKKEIAKDRKPRIAILKDRIVINSVFKIEYSLLKALKANPQFNEKYELIVYSMNYFEKSDDAEAAILKLSQIGVPVINPLRKFQIDGFYHSHLEKALELRKTIINDSMDILIAGCNNFDIEDFILANRSAPVQIYWSHGNLVYDIDGIDGRITHFRQSEESKAFEYFDLPIDPSMLESNVNEEKIKTIRARWPEKTTILGSIGRLVKVNHDEYLEAVASIMRQNPDTIYLACGAGSEENLKTKAEKLGIADRFFCEGHIDANIYGRIIDVYLDTFPLGGGHSINEYTTINHGLCILLGNRNLGYLLIEDERLDYYLSENLSEDNRLLHERYFQDRYGCSIKELGIQECIRQRNNQLKERFAYLESTLPLEEIHTKTIQHYIGFANLCIQDARLREHFMDESRYINAAWQEIKSQDGSDRFYQILDSYHRT